MHYLFLFSIALWCIYIDTGTTLLSAWDEMNMYQLLAGTMYRYVKSRKESLTKKHDWDTTHRFYMSFLVGGN